MKKMVIKKIFGLIFVIFAIGFISALTIDFPLNGENYSYSVNNLTYSPIYDSCIYTLDNWNTTLTNFSNVPSQEGTNNLILNCTNSSSGENFTASSTYWQDSVEPVISYITPNSNLVYTNLSSYSFQFLLNETNKGDYDLGPLFKPFSLKIWDPWNNPFSPFPLKNLTSSETTLSEIYPVTINSYEGSYIYIVFASDQYPNGSIIREVNVSGTIVRDTISPTISIDSPLANSNLSAEIEINFSSIDANHNYTILSITNGSVTNTTICSTNLCSFNLDTKQFADGSINISTTSYDKAGNSNSTIISIEVENTLPQVFFNNPLAGVYNSSQLVNITSSDIHLDNITLFINGFIVNSTTSEELNYLITSGNNTVYAIAYDSFGNFNKSEIRNISLDLVAPIITLLGNNTQYVELGEGYIEQNATAQDNFDGDLTSKIIINSSSINLSSIGIYSVFYSVNDTVGNLAIINRTVIVQDTTQPTLNILSSVNNTPYELGQDVSITFNISDLSNIANCTAYLNEVTNLTNITINQSENINFIFSGMVEGRYNYSISCTDSSNNIIISSTNYFTVLAGLSLITNFNEYTNLSAESDISNVIRFYVENQYGMINWTQAVDFSAGRDWTQAINLSFNLAEVNSSYMPELNKTATITLYNLTFSSPQILKNGAICLDCVQNYYVGGNLSFNVTGFSAYKIQETPVVPPSAPSGGSSSGSGGGTYLVTTSESPGCNDTWTCVWGECIDGIRTEICSADTLSCGEQNKPVEKTEACIVEETDEQAGTISRIVSITGAAIGEIGSQIGIGIIILLILIAIGYMVVKVKNRKSNLSKADLKRLETSRDSDNPILGKETNPILNKLNGKEIDETKIKDLGELR